MIAVIGCGNPTRRDDGVAAAVLRDLAARPVARRPGLRLLDAGTDGVAVMLAARGCERMVIVDACRSGAPAGAVFEAPGAAMAQARAPSLTLHDFRWEHALHAGQAMYGAAFPRDVTVLLIEAGSIDYGLELSPEVARAATRVADRVEELICQASST